MIDTEEFWDRYIHDWPWCSAGCSMPAVVEDSEYAPWCAVHGVDLLLVRVGPEPKDIDVDKLDEIDWIERENE